MKNFYIMHKNSVLAHVRFKPFAITQFSNHIYYRQFRKPDASVTISDVLDWLSDRCFPKARDNARELLDTLGLGDVGYDPTAITEMTHGLMQHDYIWMKFEGEELDYDDLPGHR